jgi:hypothetical protein
LSDLETFTFDTKQIINPPQPIIELLKRRFEGS